MCVRVMSLVYLPHQRFSPPLATPVVPAAAPPGMASETDHGEALAGAHARHTRTLTAIPLLARATVRASCPH